MSQMDHRERAKSRIVSQYRGKPNFEAWVLLCPTLANQYIEPTIDQLINSYDVDTVNDELLNVIGRIVGIDRPVLRITDLDVFGYDGNPSYTNYNVSPYIGSGDLQIDSPLNNDLYRRLIKAKIARNNSDGSYDSIIQLTTFILGLDVTRIVEGEMEFRLGFDHEPDQISQFLLDRFEIIPRPQGVRVGPYFILPRNIDEIERTSDLIFNYSNFTLPGDVA